MLVRGEAGDVAVQHLGQFRQALSAAGGLGDRLDLLVHLVDDRRHAVDNFDSALGGRVGRVDLSGDVIR